MVNKKNIWIFVIIIIGVVLLASGIIPLISERMAGYEININCKEKYDAYKPGGWMANTYPYVRLVVHDPSASFPNVVPGGTIIYQAGTSGVTGVPTVWGEGCENLKCDAYVYQAGELQRYIDEIGPLPTTDIADCSITQNTLADTNFNGNVDRTELGAFMTLWTSGSATRDDLGLAIVAWATG